MSVRALEPTFEASARALATRLGLSVPGPGNVPGPDACETLLLELGDAGLGIRRPGSREQPLRAEFLAGRLGHRLRRGPGRRQPLGRALGLGRGAGGCRVVDATAGLGRDSMLAAQMGCLVQAVERAPVVAALLEDGLARAARDARLRDVVARITLASRDARDLLPALAADDRPDVVFLDPMFPTRRKSALVKKEMRLLGLLVGGDDDADELLAAALATARRRVVVKRPTEAGPLAGRSPDLVVSGGRTTRYDVHLVG